MGSPREARSVYIVSWRPPVNEIRALDRFDRFYSSIERHPDRLYTWRHGSIAARFAGLPCPSCPSTPRKLLCDFLAPTGTAFLHAQRPSRLDLVRHFFDRSAVQRRPQLGSSKCGYDDLRERCYCAAGPSTAGFPSSGQCCQRQVRLKYSRKWFDAEFTDPTDSTDAQHGKQ